MNKISLALISFLLAGIAVVPPSARADGDGWNYGTGILGWGHKFRIGSDPADFCAWHSTQGRLPCEIVCPCGAAVHPTLDLSSQDFDANCPTISVMMNETYNPPQNSSGSSGWVQNTENGVVATLPMLQNSLGVNALANTSANSGGGSAAGSASSGSSGLLPFGGKGGSAGDGATAGFMPDTTNVPTSYSAAPATAGGTSNGTGTGSGSPTANSAPGTTSGNNALAGFGGGADSKDAAAAAAAKTAGQAAAQGAPGAADEFSSATAGAGGRAGYAHGTGEIGSGQGVTEFKAGGIAPASKGGIFDLVSESYRAFSKTLQH